MEPNRTDSQELIDSAINRLTGLLEVTEGVTVKTAKGIKRVTGMGRNADLPNAERWSLLGSIWKRKAVLYQRAGKSWFIIEEALRHSRDAYANGAGAIESPDCNLYALINCLQLDGLLAAEGALSEPGATAQLAKRCQELARKRFARSYNFFDAVLVADAQIAVYLLDGALASCTVDELVKLYRDAVQAVPASSREFDSVVRQLQMVADFLKSRQRDKDYVCVQTLLGVATQLTRKSNVGVFPDMFPPKWASEWGEDEYGLWIAFTLNGVYQTFRWIPPGTFQMGSPTEEKERYDDETQHQVTLMQGYWLADTACTQALWEAVMGNNPANFKDDNNNPMEQVSWDDVQVFLQKLNELIPGLDAALPTEAQWEYACRAGTTTPFSFGENITPEQVNYDGTEPYANGKKGLYREKTVPVKSLPANPWGLYEMHGNVWEWCQDWFGDYPSESIADPAGAGTGSLRVLRGGAWYYLGRGARSAYRARRTPDYSGNYFGFRFVSGQASNIL